MNRRVNWRVVTPLLLAWAICAPLQAQVDLTYVANEGFLLSGGGKKVLVDALFESGVSGYPTIPAELRSTLEAGKSPFDGVGLVLATHHHADHFAPGSVARFLRANPGAHFVSTPQAVAELRKVVGEDANLSARITEVYPEPGATIELTRSDIRVRVLNLHHGRDRNPPIENLGFLVEIGELTVLHVGDTEATTEDFREYDLAEERIDLALLPTWLVTGSSRVAAVREEIRPARIVAMHLPTRDAHRSYFGDAGSYDASLEAMRRAIPEIEILERPGDSIVVERRPTESPKASLTRAAESIPATRPYLARDTDLAAGKFLVARRKMPDPNFAETVVLLLEYDSEGALGLVINRPSHVELSTLAPEIEGLETRTDPIYFGGPVPAESLFVIFVADDPPLHSDPIFERVHVTRSAEVLRGLARGDDPDAFRVFAGYAGWAPGQLDNELARGDWHVVEPDEGSVFSSKPREVWESLVPLEPSRQARLEYDMIRSKY